MKTRCQPGDRCLVVADTPGCECNIGAVLTVVQAHVTLDPLRGHVPIWTFKDASRQLRVLGTFNAADTEALKECWVTHS
jgi:hypothetical protein